MQPVSVTEYAESRRSRGLPGGSRNAVELAIQDGRIKLIAKDPIRLIDPDVADKQWEENTDGDYRRNGHGDDPSFSRVRTEEKMVQIEKKRLELDRDRGLLHSVAECDASKEKLARIIRDRLLTISTRVAAEFGRDEDDRLALEARIAEEIRLAIDDLSDWAADGTE